jgi:hypothetical protein
MTIPGDRIEQATWLELARQQSQTLAQTRASTILSLRWEPTARPSAQGWLRPPRTAWVLPVLAVVVLGGATATLAFVHHLREERPATAHRSTLSITPAGERPLTKSAVRRHRSARRASTVVREKSVKPISVKRPEETPAPGDPRVKPGDESGSVIFGPDDVPGGDVIIVNPPRKQPPLWTPESYRKQRRGTLRW